MSMIEDSTPHGLTLDASVWFFAGQIDDTEIVRHVPIRSTPFRIGRRTDLSLSLACSSVSKEHAEIFEQDGAIWIRDLNSTNGTYVNGERLHDNPARLKEGDIVQVATVVFRVGREQHVPTETGTMREDACDRALAMVQFGRMIHDKAVVPFYQPIVQVDDDKQIIGYEVLGRSRLFGLNSPKEMFETASQFNLETELSRIFRTRGVEAAQRLPASANLFVNTHPMELTEDGLIESLKQLRATNPDQAMTLEIHEAAVTNTDMLTQLRDSLTELNMQLAFDDFGAGQARLVELSEVRPHFLKFDMQLVQGIHRAPPSRQQVVELLVRMVDELGIIPLAEGVETEEDHQTLAELGFQLGQGYLYGRPASVSTYAASARDSAGDTEETSE